MKPVALFEMADPHQPGHIAIGDVVRSFQTGDVAVFHDHQPVFPHQLFFPVQHLGADAGIVSARPFVGAAEYHHLFFSVAGISVGQRLQQLSPADAHDIRKIPDIQVQGRALQPLPRLFQKRP